MNILLIGYGKMGKAIEEIALKKGHFIVGKSDSADNLKEIIQQTKPDVAIEFSQPESAFNNCKVCIENQIPVVCGTTGWLTQKNALENIAIEQSGAFFYGSNFSIGVNLFFHLNEKLALLMKDYPQYQIRLDETHHIHKKDAPSGTAISLAEGILQNNPLKEKWVNSKTENKTELEIISYREDNVPGTHSVYYQSDIDTIEIKHTAHSREGFASGAVLAAEWLIGKKGVFGMNDLLNLQNI
jgi:4-hydroxy-tetrahydrodipicolinate reductase